MSTIRVAATSWGEAQIRDVQAVLDSVAKTFREYTAVTPEDSILVTQSPEQFPRALSDPAPSGERIILLATTDRKWSQLAYQFSHEYCHVFTKHYKTPLVHPFMWFEESLCELASLWCLTRMGYDWLLDPPHPNWASYGSSLQKYATDRIDGVLTHTTPEGFSEWLGSNLEEMTSNSTNRDLNQVIAVRLYPLFLKNPSLWKTVELLNQSPDLAGDFQSYLQHWHDTVPREFQDSVRTISEELGFSLQSKSHTPES